MIRLGCGPAHHDQRPLHHLAAGAHELGRVAAPGRELTVSPKDAPSAARDALLHKSFRAVGHLVDSGIMKEILDTIIRELVELKRTL